MSALFAENSGDKKSNIDMKMRLSLSLPPNAPPEPLPDLDYHLLYLLIHLTRPHQSDPRALKRYDYLADAREAYYNGITKFHSAYNGLHDANAYGNALDQEFAVVSQDLKEVESSMTSHEWDKTLDGLRKNLARIEIARRKNNEAMRDLLLDLEEKGRKRDYATSYLSSLKWSFVKTQLPELIEMGRQVYELEVRKHGGGSQPGNGQVLVEETQRAEVAADLLAVVGSSSRPDRSAVDGPMGNLSAQEKDVGNDGDIDMM